MAEYSIRKSSEACATCETAFESEQELFSMIVLAEDEPARRDVCIPCFESREADSEREFAFWRTRRTESGPVRRPIDFNVLRDLFFRMVEHHGGEYGKLCYLLGLVLLRKRVVKLEEFVSDDGRDYLVVSSRTRPEPLRLEAPELVPAEFDELREKLMALLDVDLDDDMPTSADATAASAPDAASPADPTAPADTADPSDRSEPTSESVSETGDDPSADSADAAS